MIELTTLLFDLQLYSLISIILLEVRAVFSMVRLYFLCNAIYNCS